MFGNGFQNKRNTARLQLKYQNQMIDREEQHFLDTDSNTAGVNGIDLSSPYYKDRVAQGEKLVSESRMKSNELFTNTLAQIDEEQDQWYMKVGLEILNTGLKFL